MYSKKNIIKRKEEENNFLDKNIKVNPNPIHKIYKKNYLTYRGQENNSFNYDYLGNHYKNKNNIKGNMNKFYIKKTLNLLNKKNQNQELNDYHTNNMQSIIQERIQKKKNLKHINQNSSSKPNINEFDHSTNLNKENIVENLNNLNYNISGYNTINNVGIEIKLDNNSCNSINSNNLQKSIHYGINKYNYMSRPERNYFNVQKRINTKRENLRKNYLHKSTPDLNKFLTLINDNSRDNIYLETYTDKNKLTLNTNTNINHFDNQFRSITRDNISIKRKRTRSLKYEQYKIRKELEYRKNEFEKMRNIEKKIKRYFVENGVSFKNRELYHQSGIIIQSNFRAFMIRKKVKVYMKYKGLLDISNRIILLKKMRYFDTFLDNIKIYENELKMDEMNRIKKYKINKKILSLKVETLNNFTIINSNKLNENLEKENYDLKMKLIELETQLNKLKKENENFKIQNINIINKSDNKIDIYKIKENIENVSKELEEMKSAKKKGDNHSLSYNLKSYINVNNKNFKRPNTIYGPSDLNNNKRLKEFKQLLLKYLMNLRIVKSNANKKFNFYKFRTKIKFEELNQIIYINQIKRLMDIIKNKLKPNVYFFFFSLKYKYLNSKKQKQVLYSKYAKFLNPKKTTKKK